MHCCYKIIEIGFITYINQVALLFFSVSVSRVGLCLSMKSYWLSQAPDPVVVHPRLTCNP